MEVTYSLVCYSHDLTTVFFALFNIISHLSITNQTDSLTTVITLTIILITRYLKLNIYIYFFWWNCFYLYFFNPQAIRKVFNVKAVLTSFKIANEILVIYLTKFLRCTQKGRQIWNMAFS
jgi:hypothetical protein